MSASAEQWVAFGVNMLLASRKCQYTVVPAEHAEAVQQAAADELGIETVVCPSRQPEQLRVAKVLE